MPDNAGDGELCPPGVHSMFDFCPGGCLNPEPDVCELCDGPLASDGVCADDNCGDDDA